MSNSDTKHKKALVMGASFAGLLAARVLSEFYEEVIVLERDDLSTETENRRGVPHGGHAHGLLASGSRILEELFPGISDELIAGGAVPADVVNDGRWFFEGDCLSRVPSGTTGILLGRPFLENSVRRRVRQLDNVQILDNQPVRRLVLEGGTVTGVIADGGSVRADLVIDASGRGSQTSRWLTPLGFAAPPEEKVEIRLAYTTRYFRRRAGDMEGCLFTAVTASPDNSGNGVILAQENDRWVVTLVGRFGVQPPTDLDGFIGFAKQLKAPFIYDAVRNAEPVGSALKMTFPASVRRRYEKLRRLPGNFLAFGDSICSFNPVYGQGMSVAALQAKVLRGQLERGGVRASQFYKDAAKVIDIPWNISVGSDLRMPEVEGERTLAGRLMSWYIGQVHRFAHHDGAAAVAFMRVAQLLDDPANLFKPMFALRVLTQGLRRRPKLPAARFRTEAGAER